MEMPSNHIKEFQKFQIELKLPEEVLKKALSLHEKAIKNNLQNPNLVSACVYASCRNSSTQITLKIVANIARIERRELALCYRLLRKI